MLSRGCRCQGRPFTSAPSVLPARASTSAVRIARERARAQGRVPGATWVDVRRAGPVDEKPEYADIDSNPLNRVIAGLFRRKLVEELGADSHEQGYNGIIDLVHRLNNRGQSPRETQKSTRRILNSLFPSWLPRAFKAMFAVPFPGISCKMNALVTALTCEWLMGPLEVNDVEMADGRVEKGQGLHVQRCRFLEEAGCASICINSCKIPTQEFFREDMGVSLTMVPNYETFECQFDFGRAPVQEEEDEMLLTPCFAQCPSRQREVERQCHRVATEK